MGTAPGIASPHLEGANLPIGMSVVIINIISSVVSVPVSVSVYVIVIVIVTIRIILVDDERSYFMFQYWSV